VDDTAMPREENPMQGSPYKKPAVALAIAVGAGAAAHKASVNAARVFGVPPTAVSIVVGLVLVGLAAFGVLA
jgi:hypothetical protein